MGRSQLRIETRNHEDQERSTKSLRPRLLLLHRGCLGIAFGQRLGKGVAQKMAPLGRNDQALRSQKSVIRRGARCAQDLFDLLAVRTRIAEPLGRSTLARMNQH